MAILRCVLLATLIAVAAGPTAQAARLLHITVGVASSEDDEVTLFTGIATDNGRQRGAELLGELEGVDLRRSKQKAELPKKMNGGLTIAEHGFVRIMHTNRELITVRPGKLRLVHDADDDSWSINSRDVERIIQDYEDAVQD